MIIQKAAFNIIVPLLCDNCDALYPSHLEEYFSNTPVKKSIQLDGMPLVDEENSPLKACLELLQSQRKSIGIHYNERHTYTLSKEKIDFQIRKIKLWLFKCGIAFFTFEIHTNETDGNKLLDLVSELSNTYLKRKIEYTYRIDKDRSEIKTFTFRELINNLLALQSMAALCELPSETFKTAHCLFYGFTETADKEDLSVFLEMLRRQTKSERTVPAGLSSQNKYEPETYITWAVSQKVMAAVGNTYQTSPANVRYITEAGGLTQSIFSNYIAVYLNCLSVHLKLNIIRSKYKDASSLSSAPDEIFLQLKELLNTHYNDVTTMMHINELFRVYLCTNALDLNENIKSFSDGALFEIIQKRLDGIIAQQEELKKGQQEIKDDISAAKSDLIAHLTSMQSSLGNYIKESVEKEFENLTHFFDEEKKISQELFLKAKYINEKTKAEGANRVVTDEKDHLKKLFGSTWEHLDPVTRSSLCSAGVLWKACADIKDESFDFSGICISATSALEMEIKRCFYYGFQGFLQRKYGAPSLKHWPEMLLSKDKNGMPRLEKGDGIHFTLGSLPFLLGKYDLTSIKYETKITRQEDLLKAKVGEYLNEIMPRKKDGISNRKFLIEGENNLIGKTEAVRRDYRNPAAHCDLISRPDAQKCYIAIVGKIESFDYTSDITSLLLQLYDLIDIQKMSQYLNNA